MACKLFMVLAVLGFGSAALAQQPPVPCCAPDQMVFHYSQVLNNQKGDLPMIIYRELLDGAYDFVNALVGLEVYAAQVNGSDVKFKMIQNFTSGEQYFIQGETCTKSDIPAGSAPQRCVPPGSQLEGTFDVGLEKVKVHSWLIEANSPGVIKGQQYYTVTDYMCTPLSSTFIGTDLATVPPTVFTASGNYVNMNTTIVDRDRWFKLPSSCNKAQPLPRSHPSNSILRRLNMRFF